MPFQKRQLSACALSPAALCVPAGGCSPPGDPPTPSKAAQGSPARSRAPRGHSGGERGPRGGVEMVQTNPRSRSVAAQRHRPLLNTSWLPSPQPRPQDERAPWLALCQAASRASAQWRAGRAQVRGASSRSRTAPSTAWAGRGGVRTPGPPADFKDNLKVLKLKVFSKQLTEAFPRYRCHARPAPEAPGWKGWGLPGGRRLAGSHMRGGTGTV